MTPGDREAEVLREELLAIRDELRQDSNIPDGYIARVDEALVRADAARTLAEARNQTPKEADHG